MSFQHEYTMYEELQHQDHCKTYCSTCFCAREDCATFGGQKPVKKFDTQVDNTLKSACKFENDLFLYKGQSRWSLLTGLY